jgi:spore coat protein A
LITRRKFISRAGLVLAGSALDRPVSSPLTASSLHPYVDPLPVPPAARAEEMRTNPFNPKEKIPFYRIAMREVMVKVHRDLPPTRMWTLGGTFPGPTLETRVEKGLIVEWQNRLPARHFLPIDHSLHGAGKDVPEVRGVIHLHGGRTPADSDGYPEHWVVPGKSQTCFYPSQHGEALLFYHDHTMGINRLNTYAGMMGMFLVRSLLEENLGLPSGNYEIPLLLCDRILRADGQLEYPVSDKPGQIWVPEVFGDSILANGKLLPYCDVEPRLYHLRIMNGSNGRFFRLSLTTGISFLQIGSDQGLLGAPVEQKRLLLAPGERADLLIDFSTEAGKRFEMVSDTFPVLQFRVGTVTRNNQHRIPEKLCEFASLAESKAVRTRRLTLGENMDDVQRSMGMLLNNTPWHAPVTENPVLNTTEIWEFVNLTDDSHPIHLHLVRFQVLSRRRFDSFHYQQTGELRFTGPLTAPDANERGWKDTVRCDPNMVTRIIVPFEGYTGRYVWHCHVLEHEDNEMMRPFEVLPAWS